MSALMMGLLLSDPDDRAPLFGLFALALAIERGRSVICHSLSDGKGRRKLEL